MFVLILFHVKVFVLIFKFESYSKSVKHVVLQMYEKSLMKKVYLLFFNNVFKGFCMILLLNAT